MRDPWCLEGNYSPSDPENFETLYPLNDFFKDFVRFFRKNGFEMLVIEDLDSEEIRLEEVWESLFEMYVDDYLFTILQEKYSELE